MRTWKELLPARLGAAGEGYWGRAGRAVRANCKLRCAPPPWRRWSPVHFEEYPQPLLDVVRVADPTCDKPLLIGSTARAVKTTEFLSG